ncbi:YqgQ family protein [Carnobacterium maltaromaticum]
MRTLYDVQQLLRRLLRRFGIYVYVAM